MLLCLFMLQAGRLHLRTVKEQDLETLYFYLNSIRMRGEFLKATFVSEQSFREAYSKTGFWSETQGTLLIFLKTTMIGAIWFEKVPFLEALDLQCYIFREEERSQGYMSAALSQVCRYLFATKQVQRLQLSVPGYCKAALHLAQKCGFQFEGILRSSFFHLGDYQDLCIYSLLRSECSDLQKIYA